MTTSHGRTRREDLALRLVESWITRNRSTNGQLVALKTSINTSTVFVNGASKLMLENDQWIPLNVFIVFAIIRRSFCFKYYFIISFMKSEMFVPKMDYMELLILHKYYGLKIG